MHVCVFNYVFCYPPCQTTDDNNVLIRVYSRPGLVSELGRGEFALETARRSLPFFGKYFGTQYPLPKLDMLAIPDFAGGAMENWGLVTYRYVFFQLPLTNPSYSHFRS